MLTVSRPRRDVTRVTAAFLLVALLLGACGSHNSTDAAKLLRDLTPLERQIFADHNVTQGEYDLAVQDTISCLRVAGFTVSEPVRQPTGLLEYTSSYRWGNVDTQSGPSQQQQRSVDNSQQACENRSAAVQAVYILEHAGTETQAKDAFANLVTCLRAHGVQTQVSPDSGNSRDLFNDLDKALSNRSITQEAADLCEANFKSANLQPLPGLKDAWAAYTA